jgi:hypothetical protein
MTEVAPDNYDYSRNRLPRPCVRQTICSMVSESLYRGVTRNIVSRGELPAARLPPVSFKPTGTSQNLKDTAYTVGARGSGEGEPGTTTPR